MSIFDRSQRWQANIVRALPQSSHRIRTRLAWHLARLSIESEEDFASRSDEDILAGVETLGMLMLCREYRAKLPYH